MGIHRAGLLLSLALLPSVLKALSDSEIYQVQQDAQKDKVLAREIISLTNSINQDFITLIDQVNEIAKDSEIIKTTARIEKHQGTLSKKLTGMPVMQNAVGQSLSFTMQLIHAIYDGTWFGEPTREWLEIMQRELAAIGDITLTK